jgi:hypothetical protein
VKQDAQKVEFFKLQFHDEINANWLQPILPSISKNLQTTYFARYLGAFTDFIHPN